LRLETLETRLVPSFLTPVLLPPINPSTSGSTPFDITEFNGLALFSANDGTHGRQLWASNGTAAGTFMVKDINGGPLPGSYPGDLTNLNGTLFFSAVNGAHGDQLWKSNGTAAGTSVVTDIHEFLGNLQPFDLTNVNGTLFFSTNNIGYGAQLWKSNGSAAGTFLVRDISPLFPSPSYLTNVNGTLFFEAPNAANVQELWRSNGATAGTVVVKDINPGSHAVHLMNVNGTLFFWATNGTHGSELWETNGSTAGTFLLKDFRPASNANLASLTNRNGTLFFSANDGHGAELWKTNGTATGTVVVADVHPGASGSYPHYLTNVNGTLLFQADDGTHGYQLWKINGTTAGTQMVTDVVGDLNLFPHTQTNVNGALFFDANDGTHGTELWASNGTAAGTVPVADINPSAPGSYPKYLTNVNGTLFFSANDGTHGPDFWVLLSKARADVTTTLSVSADPSVYGQAVTFTAIVNATKAGVGFIPSGTVAFEEGATGLGNAVLDAFGKGTFSTTALAAGMHTITAFYSGDHNFMPNANSADPVVQTVRKGTPITMLTVSSGSSVFGEALHFTAMVQAQAPGGGLATGTVTFKDGANILGTAPLNKNAQQAVFSISSLLVRSHTLTATYGGDGNFNASAPSAPKVEAVFKASDSIALTSSVNPSTAGQAVTFTATVHATPPGIGVATGIVAFKDGTSVLGTGALNGGVATFSTASLAAGNHAITASYGGDADFTASTSPAFGQTVHPTLAALPATSTDAPRVFPVSIRPAVPGRGAPSVLEAARVDALFTVGWHRPRRMMPNSVAWDADWLGTFF
jgi:ELWxxDGT repeat protein